MNLREFVDEISDANRNFYIDCNEYNLVDVHDIKKINLSSNKEILVNIGNDNFNVKFNITVTIEKVY